MDAPCCMEDGLASKRFTNANRAGVVASQPAALLGRGQRRQSCSSNDILNGEFMVL